MAKSGADIRYISVHPWADDPCDPLRPSSRTTIAQTDIGCHLLLKGSEKVISSTSGFLPNNGWDIHKEVKKNML